LLGVPSSIVGGRILFVWMEHDEPVCARSLFSSEYYWWVRAQD